MPKNLPVSTVIVLSQHSDVCERMAHLFALLDARNITREIVAGADEVIAALAPSALGEVQCVLVDIASDNRDDAMTAVMADLEAIASDPDIEPVAVATSPAPQTIVAAFRAGAGDFIDLDIEDDERIAAIIQRVALTHHRRVQRRRRVNNLRTVLEDMVKNLVQTERRTIELEQLLAARDGEIEPITDWNPHRKPTVLIIDDDAEVAEYLTEEMERAGLTCYTCGSGEDAVALTRQMAAREEAVDLALMDVRLPGMNGLEAIAKMRDVKPHMAAMLMTGYSDTETAIGAADMGVVGYVQKPFDDLRELVERVGKLAVKSMNDARDRRYVAQIKDRHAKVLLRYRRLATDLAYLSR
ncbi:MAG: response regulator [Myxococcota bacterium]